MGYHQPVLLDVSIEGLTIDPDGIYVDATFGGGGHSRAMLKKLKTGARANDLCGRHQPLDLLHSS